MKQCPVCKSFNNDNENFCFNCGNMLTQNETKQNVASAPNTSENKPQQQCSSAETNPSFVKQNSCQQTNYQNSPNSGTYNAAQPQNPNVPPQGPAYYGNQPQYQTYQQPFTQPVTDDGRSIGLNILAWFIPLFGIIYYFVNKKEKPIRAKSVGKTTLISFIVNMVLSIIMSVLLVVGVYSQTSSTYKSNDYNQYSPKIEVTVPETTEESKKENKKSDKNSSNDSKWNDYTVKVNGTEMTLPCSYEEFAKQLNVSMSDDDLKKNLKSNRIELVNLYDSNNNMVCYVTLSNDTSKSLPCSKCQVSSITAHFMEETDKNALVFPGKIYLGQEMTEKDLIKAVGKNMEHSYSYKSDNGSYVSDTYKCVENSDYSYRNLYSVTIVNGKVAEIQLDHTMS